MQDGDLIGNGAIASDDESDSEEVEALPWRIAASPEYGDAYWIMANDHLERHCKGKKAACGA